MTDPNSPPKKLPIPWGHVINYLILVDDQRAEDLYVEAIDRLRRCRIAFDLARDHLLYGEWLRRKRRRLDARKELRAAHDLFTDFGMDAFAERARVELQVTGERARERSADTLDHLTPQGRADRAPRHGRNEQPGDCRSTIHQSERGRISPGQVFRKLNVKSRTRLARRLS